MTKNEDIIPIYLSVSISRASVMAGRGREGLLWATVLLLKRSETTQCGGPRGWSWGRREPWPLSSTADFGGVHSSSRTHFAMHCIGQVWGGPSALALALRPCAQTINMPINPILCGRGGRLDVSWCSPFQLLIAPSSLLLPSPPPLRKDQVRE